MQRITTTVRNLLVVILCSMALPLIGARADVAPPEQAPGSNIGPAQSTKVQMAAESVLIDVLSVKGKGVSALPLSAVTAKFTMRNAGDVDETMTVRFPISDPSGYGDGFGGQPEIENVVVKVNGKIVPTTIITSPNPQGEKEPPIRWAAFDVTFPAGEDTAIDVSYVLQSTGYMPYGTFKYILETGGGWDGPIGKGEITVKLPYPATEENIVLNESTPGGKIENGVARWTFSDLEPTNEDNFSATVLAPNVWQAILKAREAVQRNPNDADAWRALARAYRQAIFVKYGPQTGANFVPQIEAAYKQAQSADPTSAQAHAELAQALIDLNQPIFDDFPKELADKVLAELQAALKLDPNNATAVKLAGELRSMLDLLVNAGNPNAQAQLDQLETIIQDSGAQVGDKAVAQATASPTAPAAEVTSTAAATPAVDATATVTPAVTMTDTQVLTPTESITPTETLTPTEAGTPAEPAPAITTKTVTATTPSGAVITTSVITATSRVITDPITGQPVTITILARSDVATNTSDLTGTLPVAVVVIRSNSVVTETPATEGLPANVVTATTSVSETSPIVDGQVMPPSGTITVNVVLTSSTQTTTDATTAQPITVTVVTQSQTSTDAAGTAPAQTKIDETVVTTQTAPNPQTGAIVVVTGTTRNIEIAPSVNITLNVPARTVTQSEVVTSTTEVNPISPTLPATITVVVQSGAVTQNAGDGTHAPSVVTSTATTTRTEEAHPLEPTMPATVTTVTTSQDVTATNAITNEAGTEAGAPVVVTATQATTSTEAMNPIDAQMPATKTETTRTQVVTDTGSISQPGARVIVTSTINISGTMPAPVDVTNPPPMMQVEQSEVTTTTVDASGQMTTTPPISSVITRTIPVLPLPTRAPRVPAVQVTPESQTTPAATEAATEAASGTVTPTETTTATVGAGAGEATPAATDAATQAATAGSADATPAATQEAAATQTAPAAQGGNTILGIPNEAWLPLIVVYLIGFIVVFALLRRRFNRNKI